MKKHQSHGRALVTAAGAATASLLILLPLSVGAQDAAKRADPQDPQAATPALLYQSSLSKYKRLGEQAPPLSWREANDNVRAIGGWRAYAREANAPEPAASAPASAAPAASAPRATRPATPQPMHRH